MDRLVSKKRNQAQRRQRVRSVVSGTTMRPRLSVKITGRHVIAQLIDDSSHQTLAYVSTVGSKSAGDSLTARAEWGGAEIAKKAKQSKLQKVVFDRGGRLYHGRVKALAEAARNEGLEF